MIESGKSKRMRRKLLKDQLTLAEAALKYARGLESADQHATKVEDQTPTDVTENYTVGRTGKNLVSIAGNSGRAKGDQENAQLSRQAVYAMRKKEPFRELL